MGFAAGFGQGFSDSYNNAKQRTFAKEQQEEDRIWQSYMSNQERINARNEKSSSLARAASGVAKAANIPESAAYDMLETGMSAAQIIDFAKTNKIEGVNTDPVAPGSDPAQAQTVDDEMVGSGMAAAESPVSAPNAQQMQPGSSEMRARLAAQAGVSPQEFDQTLAGGAPQTVRAGPNASWTASPAPAPFDSKATEEQLIGNALAGDEASLIELGRLREIQNTGKDSELPSSIEALSANLARAQQSGNPARIAEADNAIQIWKRAQYIKAGAERGGPETTYIEQEDGSLMMVNKVPGPEGAVFINPMTQEQVTGIREVTQAELDSEDKLAELVGKEKSFTEYQNNQANIANFVKLSRDLSTIVEEDPTVLTGVSNINEFANRWGAEASAGLQLANRWAQGHKEDIPLADASSMIDAADAQIDAILNSDTIQAGERKALFDAKKQLLVYQLGIMNEQSGRAFTDVDRRIHDQILNASNRDGPWLANLKQINADVIGKADAQAMALNNNSLIRNHQRRFGSVPEIAQVKPISEFLGELNEPGLVEFATPVPGAIPDRGSLPQPQPQQEQPQPTSGPSSRHIEALRANPGMADQFDAKFGPGAAARILGSN